MHIFKNLTMVFCIPGNSTSTSPSMCIDLYPQCRENSRYCNIGDYAVIMSRLSRLICQHCTSSLIFLIILSYYLILESNQNKKYIFSYPYSQSELFSSISTYHKRYEKNLTKHLPSVLLLI